MSKTEIERFAKDLKTNLALLADIVALAARHGYRFTADDAKALSDGALDDLAGGDGRLVDAAKALADAALAKVSGGAGQSLPSPSPEVLLDAEKLYKS
jgi:hypothetical protein